jgi:predicted ATPase
MGQPEEGLRLIAEALTTAHNQGHRRGESELYRLKGELLLKAREADGRTARASTSKDEESPEGCFLKAIDVARRQSAKSLELRAVLSLSRLWQKQGKKKGACQMLGEIYGWFIEGFDTPDLKEAKALFEELS